MFQSAGSLIEFIDPFSGNHIKMNSGQLVKAICRAARNDAKLRNWCLAIIHSSGYTEIVSAAIILVLPILVYHGLIPMRFFSSMGDNGPVEDNQN